MKQFSFSVPLLLLLIALTTASCKKIPVIERTNAHLSFKVDGVYKETKGDKNVFAAYAKELTILQIIGNLGDSDEHQIGLTINNFHGVGEYTGEDFLGLYTTPEQDQSIVSNEGKVKITEYTEGKSIKGEFQFKGQPFVIIIGSDPEPAEDKIFSEGKFEAKVSTHSGPIVTP